MEVGDLYFVTTSDEHFEHMEAVFGASKDAGKPWPVFVSSVMMAPHVGPDPRDAASLPETAPDPDELAAFWDATLPTNFFGAWRRIVAGKVTSTSWNRDGSADFIVQPVKFAHLCKEHAAYCVLMAI